MIHHQGLETLVICLFSHLQFRQQMFQMYLSINFFIINFEFWIIHSQNLSIIIQKQCLEIFKD